ncbi:MAG: TRAP transporter large permease subunit [Planctomycetes bacterium]|nr:TRAP transporter large permease subunit [Planctomycetota bacterium]
MTDQPTNPAPGLAPRPSGPWRLLHGFENSLGNTALVLMAALPVAEIAGRRLLGQGVPGSISWVQNLTLVVAFLGGILAARDRRHLALATTTFLPRSVRGVADFIGSAVASAVAAVLAWAAYQTIVLQTASNETLSGGIPVWVVEAIMPIGFAVIAIRLWWQSGMVPPHTEFETEPPTPYPPAAAWTRRAIVLALVVAAFSLGWLPEASVSAWRWPLVAVVIGATVLGAPIFVLLGGVALVLFHADAVTVMAVPTQTIQIVAQPTLPTLPLFTLAGTLLARGGTPERLLRVFRALAGWLPGGTAVAAVLACAFFTTFTGASGVTILALGALLLPVLIKDVYSERFSLGTVTASGSIGLLFPPSLPIILYGVSARVPVNEMFYACILPGFVLVGLVSAYCVREGVARGAIWKRPDPREVVSSCWAAKWEIALPIVVFVSLFGGFATTVEAAALTVLYAFFIKCVVYRDVSIRRDLPKVLTESTILVGGVLIILGAALGLTSYLIDAQIPARGAEWVKAAIHSRWAFLLALNGFLLIVGCLMDIFSAIFVVVPLILPIAAVFGINPLHLGAIFLINLELGYLTPPVGMNLFLSSYRFNRPMSQITRAVLPFMFVQLTAVLLVTYIPWLSEGFATWWAR